MRRTLAWALDVLLDAGQLQGSDLAGREGEFWYGASIDSRGDCTGRIFFALKGEKTDGHRYLGAAAGNGAVAAVVDDASAVTGLEMPYLLVEDALAGLQELSRAYRQTLDLRIVAVTGSAGKTSTKEYIRTVLKKKYRVHSSPGNFNNHIGVPLTILDTAIDNEYLVSEVGANHVGEIEFLSSMLRPDIGVITNIGDAHIGLFGSRENIARAKSELFTGVDAGGYAVLPEDDEFIDVLKDRAQCRTVTFGEGEASTYRVSHVEEGDEGYRFQVNGEPVAIRRFGRYNVNNACAAYAVGEICGVEIESIRDALLETEPMPGRALVYASDDYTIIDDSYNANPTSMRAAVDSLVARAQGRRVAVLGEMGELGEFSDDLHRELGNYIAEAGIEMVFWLGAQGDVVKEGSVGKKGVDVRVFDSIDGLTTDLKDALAPGDTVLVKASRASQLDRVVAALRADLLGEGSV